MADNFFKVKNGLNLTPLAAEPSGLQIGDLWCDLNGKVYRYDGSISKEIGAGQGGINYISANPDFEGNTTGYVAYADAAGTSPVDGTGGSPNVTITRTTSSPLRGTASGLITKDAVNRQGQGVSYDFSIDPADRGKVLQGSLEYSIASGTYATGDLSVWIYDVTNAVVIACAPTSIQNSTITERFAFEFQSSISSSSYRLIFHVASTSASAYTVKIDNLNISNAAKLFGSPVTDWNSFTPTSTWVSNVTHTGQWRRVGDSMELRVNLAVTGAPTNTALDINLPSGYSIDTAKVAGFAQFRAPLGLAVGWDGGSNYPFEVTYSDSATKVRILSINASSSFAQGNNLSSTAPFTWANGTSINATFKVPIVGWGSTVQMSDSADTRVVGARAQIAGAVAVSTTQMINFATVTYDTHGAITTGAAWKYTAPVAGYYRVGVAVDLDAGTSIGLYKNGTLYSLICDCTNTPFIGSGADTVFLVAGDYIDIRLTAGSTNTNPTAINTHIAIEKVSGPSQVAASEQVYARYATDSAVSIANSGETLVNFEDKVFDSHNAVTIGASWKFTAPVSGIYQVSSGNQFSSATYAVGNVIGGGIYKNGSANTYFNTQTSQAATGLILSLMCPGVLISLNAGDYIDIRLANTRTAGATTLNGTAASNYITIAKL